MLNSHENVGLPSIICNLFSLNHHFNFIITLFYKNKLYKKNEAEIVGKWEHLEAG